MDSFNYVKGFDLFGVKARQIPCLTAKGEPSNELALKIGLLYINEDNGDMYKCVKGNGEESLVWVLVNNKDTSTDSGQSTDLAGYAKEAWVQEGFQPKGDYLTSAPVTSVNGKTGSVQLSSADVGARPDNWVPTAQEVGADPTGRAAAAVSAHNTSTDAHTDMRQEIKAIREQLAAFLDVDEETLNELSELIARIVANQTSISQLTTGKVSVSDIIDNLITNASNKPLSAAQGVAIKALIDNMSASLANYQPKGNYASLDDIPNVPNWSMQASKPAYTASEVGADPKGTAASAMSNHNTSTDAHTDLRQQIKAIREQLTAFLDVDEETLNELSELIARIVANQTSIEQLTTGKVNVADIINNLTTNVVNKPLSAAQGVAIKALIDGLSSGKLDSSKLGEAINTALAQAKANGEFDGADGDPGRGIKSIARTSGNGAAGTVDTYTITYTDNTTGTFQVRNGSNGADGKDGLDATPVTPLFANSVEECTDTTKPYVLPDGFIYAYQYVEATGPSYTNLAGTITYDKRLSSSGKVSSSAMAGACYTDFIPVKKGQTVRIENLDVYTNFSTSAFPYVCFYTGASENNVVSSTVYARPSEFSDDFVGAQASVNGDVVTWEAFLIGSKKQHPLADEITHIRISGKYFADKEVIVTVDEEITDVAGGSYQWVNTGHAFVPADYEAEILALQENKVDKTAIPAKLPNPNPLTIDGVKYDGSAAVDIKTQSGGNILSGKKWVACGDSFTHGGYNASDGFDSSVYVYQDGRFAGKNIVYPYIIGLRNNMNIVNLAAGGQTMAVSSNSFMSVYQNIDADADYITIMMGINDKVQGLPVGTLEDCVNTTFCGAYNIAMEHILENHPFAHIGIMVSHGTNKEIMEATRGIAERWGVPYLDYGSPQVPLMNRYTGRDVCVKAQEIRERNFCVASNGTTPTNAHPNTAAHEYESTFIEAWLRTL